MEMTHHVSSSIELIIGSYGTNSDIRSEIKRIDSMGECVHAAYISNIMIICEYPNKPIYDLSVNI